MAKTGIRREGETKGFLMQVVRSIQFKGNCRIVKLGCRHEFKVYNSDQWPDLDVGARVRCKGCRHKKVRGVQRAQRTWHF